MNREKLGSFLTNTASILIGDPCRFVKDKGEPSEITYTGLMDLWRFHEMVNYSARETPSRTGVAVNVECDGWYSVYLVRDADGVPVRLEIDLGGKVEP
jgi:hypothetical protein